MMATTGVANQVFRQLRDGRSTTETTTYVAVPGTGVARWLLPAASPEIGSVLASWAPYRLWPRVVWAAVRAASQLGQAAEIPGASVLEVEGTRGADWESLGWKGGVPPIPVIYLGTPGPRRKAVVHLVDRVSGTCHAVVKVPLTDGAKASVLHEAEVLAALATERFEHSPRLLHADRERAITTQSFVEGNHGTRKLTPECWRLLRSLLLTGETTTLAEYAEKWTREIDLEGDDSAGSWNVVAAIDELRDDSSLPVCWEHGDFTPWNIKRLSGGGCALLDWEDAKRGGLPLQDAFHFLHMQDWLFGGQSRLHAAEVWREAVAMDVPSEGIRGLEVAYLAGAYLKCVHEQNHGRARFVSHTLALLRRKAA